MAASLDLDRLNGHNGFRIDGIGFLNESGAAVHGAGDFNGDGIADLVIGAPLAPGDGFIAAGETYVVFGSTAGFDASLDLSALDGTNGFRIDGID
ncbi:MAG: integrin alpha, partial [Pseudomonadota bacterium]